MSKEFKNVLKNLGLALLSTPIAGILAFFGAALVSLLYEMLNFIERPWGFRIYFLIGFILSFIYLQFKSKKEG